MQDARPQPSTPRSTPRAVLVARMAVAGLTTAAVLFAVAEATLPPWHWAFSRWFPGLGSRMWLLLTWLFPPLIVLVLRVVWPAARSFSLAAIVPVLAFLGLWHSFNVDLYLWTKRTVWAMGGADSLVVVVLWAVLGIGVFTTSFLGTYLRASRKSPWLTLTRRMQS